MIKFLIYRPIAVIITTLSLVLLGLITFKQIPVSLLPDIPIPEITVQIKYPSSSAKELNQSITRPIFNQLQQVNHLTDIEAESKDGLAILKLRFAFGADINLAYIECNEKIDAIISILPKDLERPQVIKAGSADIPIFNLNVWIDSYSQNSSSAKNKSFLELSEFCENILKRRIEQLSQVALVDISGLSKTEVVIVPDQNVMQSLKLSEEDFLAILEKNNVDFGNFVIKDGQYQYNIRFSSTLKTIHDIEDIFIRKGDRIFQLKEIAKVNIQEQKLKGLYSYNGNRAICLSIIKQSDAQLLELKAELDREINQFKKDYPQLSFATSQDQTELLTLSINNLIGNIIFGGLCTVIMIFFFMNDFKTPVLVSLVIPISLTITFLSFYLFHISINIVSLAGLVLGIGEIIDSSIIVIENIEYHREKGKDLETSCIYGTQEVVIPLFTSILTNSAVFLPLIFMSGIAGALFFDQAVSVSLSLAISLLCSYTLIPVLYFIFYKKQKIFQPKKTIIYSKAEQIYYALFSIVFQYKKSFLLFFAILALLFSPLAIFIKKQGMPPVSHTELEVRIDWNESINVEESEKRINRLMRSIHSNMIRNHSAFIGQQQFLLNQNLLQNANEIFLSIKVKTNEDFNTLKNSIDSFLKSSYPSAAVYSRPAKNVFEQIFNTAETPLQIQVTNNKINDVPNIETINELNRRFTKSNLSTNLPSLQNRIFIKILSEKLLIYEVDYEAVYQKLKTIFDENLIGNLQAEQKYIPIIVSMGSQKNIDNIRGVLIKTKQGNFVSLSNLIEVSNNLDYKTYYRGQNGTFIPFNFKSENIKEDIVKIENVISTISGINVSFSGDYFKNKVLMRDLTIIIVVAIGLLYFILTAQFESLKQPLIVILTIAFGITGALMLLFITGSSINIMSAIGIIVLIGILDNDSILKIDTMNRSKNSMELIDAIRESGKKRLKSQLMTFFTTVLGLLPVIFSSGLGSELQKPLALSVIGGMCLGLFISLSFIPLVYWLNNHKVNT